MRQSVTVAYWIDLYRCSDPDTSSWDVDSYIAYVELPGDKMLTLGYTLTDTSVQVTMGDGTEVNFPVVKRARGEVVIDDDTPPHEVAREMDAYRTTVAEAPPPIFDEIGLCVVQSSDSSEGPSTSTPSISMPSVATPSIPASSAPAVSSTPALSSAAPVASSAAPVASSAAPVASSAAPVASSAAPVASSAVDESSAVEESSTAPVTSSAAPVTSSAAPEASSAAPEASSAAPEASSAAPEASSAAPEASSAAPEVSSAAPEESSAVAVASSAVADSSAAEESSAVPEESSMSSSVTFVDLEITAFVAASSDTVFPSSNPHPTGQSVSVEGLDFFGGSYPSNVLSGLAFRGGAPDIDCLVDGVTSITVNGTFSAGPLGDAPRTYVFSTFLSGVVGGGDPFFQQGAVDTQNVLSIDSIDMTIDVGCP